ncbi:MAG TPA: hypothetical protein VMU42_15520 [Candidatus Sulfotelmatobacter sp.]|nr:hypothetical protein [Candidatus Sulfotelmatobacter sp.]
MRRFLPAAVLILALVVPVGAALAAGTDACTVEAVAVEHERDLPPGLLHAVALVESGHEGKPHPYALRIGRRSYYPDNEAEALKLLRDRRGRFKRNVMVGCMQLSLAGYGGNFFQPEQILEPAANVRTAAEYLLDWKETAGSWSAALARFQGGRPRARQAYVCRIWNYLRVLHPASAGVIDSRHCAHIARPHIDPETAALADRLREAAK